MFQLLGRILIWLWFSLLLMSLIAICDEYGEYIRFQKKMVDFVNGGTHIN